MAAKRVVIDWDWGASGIWTVRDPAEVWEPPIGGRWLAHPRPADYDRHAAWRGLLSDELIAALQEWNDRGDAVMGRQAHLHSDQERRNYWSDGQRLARRTQDELGPDYEVTCPTGLGQTPGGAERRHCP